MKLQAVTLITKPTLKPLTLKEAKDYLRVDTSDEDDTINALIDAATDFVSGKHGFTGLYLNTQTWDIYTNEFADKIVLPINPVQSITHIKYKDNDGVQQTLSSSVYSLNNATLPNAIELAYNQEWPDAIRVWDSIVIRVVAGYTDIPASIKSAMKLIIGDLYQNREGQALVNGARYEINNTVKALLNPYRIDLGV